MYKLILAICLFGVAAAQFQAYNPYNSLLRPAAPLAPLSTLAPLAPRTAFSPLTRYNSAESQAQILRQTQESSPNNLQYQYSYETQNGIQAEQSGVIRPIAPERADLEVRGANQYVAPDGQLVVTSYIANQNGYQPQGSHIPRAPAIPPAILKSLAEQNVSPAFLRAAGFSA